MKKTILSFAMLLLCGVAFADNYRAAYNYRTVEVKNPILTDTVNAKGEAFKALDILKTSVVLDFTGEKYKTVYGGMVCFDSISFERPTKNNYIHLLGFHVYTNLYREAKIDFVSPNMFEVYVDGKLMGTKSSLQDSVSEQSKWTLKYKFEPREFYDVTVKLLSQSSDKCSPTIKVECADNEGEEAKVYVTGEGKRFYEHTDNFIGKRVAGVSISPCGEYVLSTYSERYDTKKIEYYKVLTTAKDGKVVVPRLSSSVQWMPQSSKLYYTVKADKGFDVMALNPATMQEEVLLDAIPQQSFTWSPAEDYLVFMVKEEAKKNDSKMMTYHASQMDRVDGRGRTLLAKYDVDTRVTERITYGNRSSQLNDISLDGKKMLFTTSTTDYTLRHAMRTSLYEVDMETFEVDTILKDQHFLNQAAYSPDMKEILLTAGPEAFDKVGMNCGKHKIPNNYDTQVFILNRASNKVRPITKDFDPAISALYSWNAGNNTIYVKAEDGMYECLFAYDVAKGEWEKLSSDESVVRAFSIDNNGKTAVYTGLSMDNSSRSYVYNVAEDKSTLLADPMKSVYDNIELGKVEDFVFKTKDGSKIDGYVCFPPRYDETKKYPMIVYYYGGTSPSQKWNEFYYGAHLFASRGYMVYVVNPSGTTGYGQEFSARHVNAWGIKTADEIIEGVKRVCKKYTSVDATKIGCIGASYGGFMTQYLLTKTDIFAGAVSHAGISNVASYWGEGYWGVGYSYVASAESYPWNNPKLYIEQGSLFNADKITTPILLMHGAEDTNVPVGESIQLYNALKRLGKDVEFIEVEGEDHTIVRSLDRQILWHKAIMAWFAKTLQGAPEWWNEQYPKVWTE